MNNNGCQFYLILLPNLLVSIEIIDIQKLVTHVTHCLSGVYIAFIPQRQVVLIQRTGPAWGAPSQAEHRHLATGP